MNILVTNDDGIFSEGLRLMALELQKDHNVFIVAPDSEKSATAHAITLRNHMELKKVKLEGIENTAYSLSGTPADCVRVAMSVLYDKIDIVFSGINKGYNAGVDIQYSGTVSACAEANVYKIPGVAVSCEYKDGSSDFSSAAKYIPGIFDKFKDLILGEVMVFNINIPKLPESQIKGMKLCPLGGMIYDTFTREEISKDLSHIHLSHRLNTTFIDDSDRRFLGEGYITLSPIKYSFHENQLMEKFLAIK